METKYPTWTIRTETKNEMDTTFCVVLGRDEDNMELEVVARDIMCFADARLMATAPELLRDLHEAMVELCCDCRSNSTEECTEEQGKCFVQRWRKTIKKAGGN